MAHDQVAAGHGARVGDPLDQPGVGGRDDRASQRAPVPGGQDADRCVGEALERRPEQPVIAVLRGGGRHQNQGIVPRRKLHVLGRRLPHQRPHHPRPRRPLARVFQLGKRGHQAQPPADAAVYVLQRGQAQQGAGVVELPASAAQPAVHRAGQGTPQRTARRGAGYPRAERVGRMLGRGGRKHVGDQGRHRDALELAGQRGPQCEDVGHHCVRTQPRDQHRGVPGGAHDRLVGLERALSGGEDVVLGRGGERHARRLDMPAPALPGLEGHVVAARREALAQRQHRKGVPGIAEGGEEKPAPQDASVAIWRSCSTRSSASKDIGLTMSVPTPASR